MKSYLWVLIGLCCLSCSGASQDAPPSNTCASDEECTDGQYCDGNQECAEGCVDDAQCQDEFFCNGQETCVDHQCTAAADPASCDDQVSCTVDLCDAATDACVSVPDATECVEGATCDVALGCYADCGGDGLLQDDGSCQCNSGFAGRFCEFGDAVTCNGQGTAQADGSCACEATYAGPSCEYSDSETCNDQGTVDYLGGCSCDPGTTGESCQHTDLSTCNGNGVAQENGTCQCSPGFVGPVCEYSDAATCSDQGAAQPEGSCVCQPGFGGADCALDVLPEPISFANLVDQELTTVVSSETITVSGFDGLLGASATEPGASAELSVAGGAWAQGADISAGQSLQVRVTTASDFVTPVELSVSVGAVSTTWTVTTRRPILPTCKAFLDGGYITDGIYLVDPDGAGAGVDPFDVYCDQATDGGGWTLYSTGQHPGQGPNVPVQIEPADLQILDPDARSQFVALARLQGEALLAASVAAGGGYVRYDTTLAESWFYREGTPTYWWTSFNPHDSYEMAGGYAGHAALVQQGDAYCETDWNTIQSSGWQGPLPIGQLTCGNPSYVTNFVAGGGGYCSPQCPACWMLMSGSGMWQTAPCAYLGLVDRRWMR